VKPDFARILELLDEGASLDDAVAATAPGEKKQVTARNAVTDRCFAVRFLDEQVFAVVRATVDGGEQVALKRVVDDPFISAVPDRPHGFVTERAEREQRLRRWMQDRKPPDWLPELSRRLADLHATDDERDELEEVFHRLADDTAEGITRLREVFGGAERTYDLARCRDLIELADERTLLCGSTLVAERNQLQRRHDARRMWRGAYARTVRFAEPGASRKPLDALVAGETRVLRIVGPSGSGKSTHLDSLIARRCVPAGFACALVDLSAVDPLIATKEPWLLLLEIAHQLDRQLPESPLFNLLLDYGANRARLLGARERGTVELGHLAPSDKALRDLDAHDVRAEFVDALRQGAPPILIALDSLETALLADDSTATHHGTAALVEELERLLEGVPSARLVLSGQSDDAGETEAVTAPLDGMTLRLGGFSPDEAYDYLVKDWGLQHPEPLLREAASVFHGSPAELTRVGATLADAGSDATTERLKNPRRWYIEQRLSRIEDPAVRQLVRYGVIPRQLDEQFVRDVLAGPLAASTGGDRVDVALLWSTLSRHLALVTWARVDVSGSVTFRAHMAEPMRELLREDEPATTADLQRAAAEHYEGRAKEDPERWSDWIAEALYHRFRLDESDAVGFWRASLQQAKGLESRHVVRLCVELLELVGTVEQPDPDVIREAWLEFAWANVRLARETPGAPPSHDGWARAAEGLASADRQRSSAGFPAKRALVQAALTLRDGDARAAADILADALRGKLTAPERVRVRAEYADALAELGWEEAVEQHHAALTLAGRVPNARPEPAAILRRMAAAYAHWSRYEAAIEACREGLAAASPGSLSEAELALLHAELHIRTGAAGAVDELVAPARSYGDMAGHGAVLVRARAALAAWDPNRAARLVAEAIDKEPADGAAESQLRRAELHELAGVANSHLLESTGAFEHLEQAALLWSAAGFTTGTARCHTLAAELQLRGLQDVRGAGLTLRKADDAAPPAKTHEARWLRLRRAEWADRSGRAEEARRLIQDVIADLRADGAPADHLVQAAVEGLALSTGDPKPFLELLAEQLERVEGAAGRLALLDGLWRCPTPERGASELMGKVYDALPLPGEDALELLSRRDRGLLLLRHAEVARVCRRRRTARRRLRDAQEALQDELDIYGIRRLFAASGRVEDDKPARHLLDPAIARGADEHPLLRAALLLERAQRSARRSPRLLPWLQRSPVPGLLQQAQATLAERAGPQGQWAPLMHALTAEVTADEATAQGHRVAAKRLYGRLDGRAQPPEAAAGSAAVVSLRRDGSELLVTTRLPDGTEGESVASPGPWLSSALRDLPAADVAAYRRVARAFPHDWSAFATEAAEVLVSPVLRDSGAAEAPLSIRLEAGDRILAALPWELGLAPARAAGSPGLGTLFRTPQYESPPPFAAGRRRDGVLRVLALRPSQTTERRAMRGPSATASLSLSDAYAIGAGSELTMLAAVPLQRLERTLRELRPDILHVSAPLTGMTGAVAIDLNAGESPPAAGRLTATGLERLLSSAGPPLPLIVLEPPGAPRANEQTQQLLLRNLFAMEVLTLTGGAPLIATGLMRYEQQDRLYEALRHGLNQYRTVAELVARLRTVGDDGDRVASATALFASSADVRLPVPSGG